MSLNVLRKADELLQLLMDTRELTVSELAERSGEPRTSLYRILSTLHEQGFVQPGQRPNTYSLGTDLFRYAHIVIGGYRVSDVGLEPLQRLFTKTGETTYLVIRHESTGICLARIDGRRVQSAIMHVGGALPLHHGAAPMTLLAFAPEEVRRAYLEDLAAAGSEDAAELDERLTKIREAGHAISTGAIVPGIAGIAVPVLSADGTAVASVAMSGSEPAILADVDDHVALVKEAAEATERRLAEAI
ncbi:MAG: IclR family transcriptional regulator [Thermoleophilia bacterium]|nr:IclR family transcriptional regulator [Thermoleophilia bacterium]